MDELLEIRWHGRGGQGAKTAAVLLAEVLSASGKFIQGFPEYGPERMGAPVVAFNRISDAPISLHCHVTEPQVVAILDPTLLGKVPVTDGLPQDGVIIVNTPVSPSKARALLGIDGARVYSIDATQIAIDTLGRNIPNTPMIAAVVQVTGLMPVDLFIDSMRTQLEDKFKGKKSIVEGNIQAMKRAASEVRSE